MTAVQGKTGNDAQGDEYEFGRQENAAIELLARRMKLTGFIQIVAAALQLAGYTGKIALLAPAQGAKRLAVELPVVVAFVLSGVLLLSASSALRGIVATKGNDIGLL